MASSISESEFARICEGIREDRASITKHNPIGTRDETLLWMLMSTLVVYLSLSDIETPCFTGRADAETYRQAIYFIVDARRSESFDVEPFLVRLVSE